MPFTFQERIEETKLEKKLQEILEPDKKPSIQQSRKKWESLDTWLEERHEQENQYVLGALTKAATDPGSTLHPDVLHDEVSALLRVFYQLKSCCPEIYDRRITEQVLLQVLFADVLSLCLLSLNREGDSHGVLDSADKEKLSLTLKKLELLGRGFQDASLAWEMALLIRDYNRIGLSSDNAIESFFSRWKELSGRKIVVPADEEIHAMFLRSFKEADGIDGALFHGGLGVQNPYSATNMLAGRMKKLISGVDLFVKKEPCPELADLIVRKKDMELTVTALNNNLISSDETEIDAAVEAAVQAGEAKVIPMLIRKRWEAER